MERARPGIPFEVPQGCLPNRRNIRLRYTGEYCSFECRNNSRVGWNGNGYEGGVGGVREGFGGARDGHNGRERMGNGMGSGWCGDRDARFGPGSERIGVGWRC
jgi:hypothetical protein